MATIVEFSLKTLNVTGQWYASVETYMYTIRNRTHASYKIHSHTHTHTHQYAQILSCDKAIILTF